MHIQETLCFIYCLYVFIQHQTSGQNAGNDLKRLQDVTSTNQAEIVTVAERDTAVLPCSYNSTGGNKVIWIGPDSKLLAIDDKLAQEDKRFSIDQHFPYDWNFQIESVLHEDQGLYECRINSQPAVVKPVILVVQVYPSIRSSSSDRIDVYEGTDFELRCHTTGIPQPTVTWYRLQFARDQGEQLEADGGESYLISNMTESKAGYYACQASNGVGKGARDYLEIKYKHVPKFILPEVENVKVEEGHAVILPCIVRNLGEFTVQWYWARDLISSGRTIFSSNRYSFTSSSLTDWTLQINPVSYYDSAVYKCQVHLSPQLVKEKIINLLVLRKLT